MVTMATQVHRLAHYTEWTNAVQFCQWQVRFQANSSLRPNATRAPRLHGGGALIHWLLETQLDLHVMDLQLNVTDLP